MLYQHYLGIWQKYKFSPNLDLLNQKVRLVPSSLNFNKLYFKDVCFRKRQIKNNSGVEPLLATVILGLTENWRTEETCIKG